MKYRKILAGFTTANMLGMFTQSVAFEGTPRIATDKSGAADDYSSISCSSWAAQDSNVITVKIRHDDRIELGIAVITSDGSNALASIVGRDEFAKGAIRSVGTRVDTDPWSTLSNDIFAVKMYWEGSSSPNLVV